MLFFSRKKRAFELGPYPLERLKRDVGRVKIETEKAKICRPIDLEKNQTESIFKTPKRAIVAIII